MSLPTVDVEYLMNVLVELLNTPSPTGFANAALDVVNRRLHELELPAQRTIKGVLVSEWPGANANRPRALTAHVDTLGAMVKEIKPNGRLKLTKIGGFGWSTVEGEGCQVFTAAGESIRGSLLCTQASRHVFGAAPDELVRTDERMEVRLDALTTTNSETRSLGIDVGDYVAFDPRVELSPSGFIRSRHLDDKAGVACLLAAAQAIRASGRQPTQRTTLHFSHYEEVGHGGASGFPHDLAELVAVDMAAVGEGQNSDEFHTTICVKDSNGPYHIELTQHLRQLAQSAAIPHRMDIYPFYGSDGEAYWRAGGDVQVALVGPGVDASHNYERTHQNALIATTQLLLAYVLGDR